MIKYHRYKKDLLLKIAVVGSGISGLGSAFVLAREREVHLFEADSRLGGHANTAKVWRENFNRAKPFVEAMGFDQKFDRLWNLYLSYCEGAFRTGRINVGQFLISKCQRK